MADTRFTKIKYDEKKVRIEYQRTRDDGNEADEYTLLSVDRPTEAFVVALNALTDDVVAICELEPHQGAQIDVRGVSLTWTDGILGACITALKRLTTANAPLVLNTPHLPSQPYSEGNPNEPVLPAETVVRLEALMAEAQKYVDGERAQANLFAETAA